MSMIKVLFQVTFVQFTSTLAKFATTENYTAPSHHRRMVHVRIVSFWCQSVSSSRSFNLFHVLFEMGFVLSSTVLQVQLICGKQDRQSSKITFSGTDG